MEWYSHIDTTTVIFFIQGIFKFEMNKFFVDDDDNDDHIH